jgi:Rieske Fe-S protein
MRVVSGVAGVGAAVVAAFPALRALTWPMFRAPPPDEWTRLGDADQFEFGVPTKVDFVQTIADAWVETRVLRNVWVLTEDGENFTVFSGRCTHLGCSFAFDSGKGQFRCPCHEGAFALKTGEVLAGPPPRPLDRLRTKVDDGQLFVEYRDFRLGVPAKNLT